MYEYKIEKINFNNGTTLNMTPLAIIVGPNNCGKSRILKDITLLMTQLNSNPVIVKDIVFNLPNNIEEFLGKYEIKTYEENGQISAKDINHTLSGGSKGNFGNSSNWEQNINNLLQIKEENSYKQFCHLFGSFLVTLLNTESRLMLVKESPSGDVNLQVENLLQAIYKQGKILENDLRKVVKDSFGIDIKLDFSSLSKLVLRIGENLDTIPDNPMESRSIFEKLEKLDDQGDGMKSFIATYLAIKLGKKPILLLDEPEAFLHPPQAMQLGEIIAKETKNNQQVIIATHSSDFLKGVLNVRQDISIIRVDRKLNTNTINTLDAKEISLISKDPLLSSSRILEGLFYKASVIVEADADSIFYQRISRQIRSSDEIHYVHAHNKQTVYKAAKPYKNFGINYAAIVDFDVLREKMEFKKIIEQLFTNPDEINRLLEIQELIKIEIESIPAKEQLENLMLSINGLIKEKQNKIDTQQFDYQSLLLETRKNLGLIVEQSKSWSKFKEKGFLLLSSEAKTSFTELNKLCKSKGLFIVPGGELESWLKEYGVNHIKNKSKWIVKALETLPQLKPDKAKNPWAFIDEIHNYLLK